MSSSPAVPASGGFVPAYGLVTSPGAQPSRWMMVLHGILGSGANWRSFARRLSQAHPAWGFVLVDLRMHGRSQGAPPPHTLSAVVDDLVRLEKVAALPIAAVMGHSFGGKVALAFAARRSPELELEQAWVLDASPSARVGRASETEGVLRTLRELPEALSSREEFVELVTARGRSRAIAEWLAMNVRPADHGYRFGLDLDAIQSLLDDYCASDLWSVLEREAGARAFHEVVSGRSSAFDGADRARLAGLAARGSRVHEHVIEGAGHWVHVDAPDALFELIGPSLGIQSKAS